MQAAGPDAGRDSKATMLHLACPYCRWDSSDVGVVGDTAAAVLACAVDRQRDVPSGAALKALQTLFGATLQQGSGGAAPSRPARSLSRRASVRAQGGAAGSGRRRFSAAVSSLMAGSARTAVAFPTSWDVHELEAALDRSDAARGITRPLALAGTPDPAAVPSSARIAAVAKYNKSREGEEDAGGAGSGSDSSGPEESARSEDAIPSGAPDAPAEIGIAQHTVADALQTARSGLMAAAPAVASGRRATPRSLFQQAWGVRDESKLLPVGRRLLAKCSVRCRECVARSEPGILLKPQINPLTGDSGESVSVGKWFKKQCSARHSVPSVWLAAAVGDPRPRERGEPPDVLGRGDSDTEEVILCLSNPSRDGDATVSIAPVVEADASDAGAAAAAGIATTSATAVAPEDVDVQFSGAEVDGALDSSPIILAAADEFEEYEERSVADAGGNTSLAAVNGNRAWLRVKVPRPSTPDATLRFRLRYSFVIQPAEPAETAATRQRMLRCILHVCLDPVGAYFPEWFVAEVDDTA